MRSTGGKAYEARRLVPPQNLGPHSVPPQNFCRQMLLDPRYGQNCCTRCFLLDQKHTNRFRSGFAPDPAGRHWVTLHRSQTCPPSPKPHPHLGPLGLELQLFEFDPFRLAPLCLLTFDCLLPPLMKSGGWICLDGHETG